MIAHGRLQVQLKFKFSWLAVYSRVSTNVLECLPRTCTLLTLCGVCEPIVSTFLGRGGIASIILEPGVVLGLIFDIGPVRIQCFFSGKPVSADATVF